MTDINTSETELSILMDHLMKELEEGRKSGKEEGYLSSEEVREYFRHKKA